MVLELVLMLEPPLRDMIGVVVEMTMPVASVAKKEPLTERAVCPVVVALVRMVELAFRLVKVEVVALINPVAQRLVKATLPFKLTVLLLVMLMFVPPNMEDRKEVVAINMPLASVAKTLPVIPLKNCCPVVVALVRMVELAFRLVKVEVEAFMAPLTFSKDPLKVKLEEVATPLVPLP
jgi:hypothetical protein